MNTKRVYNSGHGILGRDYLDAGHDVRLEIETSDIPAADQRALLIQKLALVYARIPKHYWDPQADQLVASRSTWRELVKYYENASRVKSKGLGLTLIGKHSGNRTHSLYLVGREIIIRGYSCFIIYFDELVYFLKESWKDVLLKGELAERFQSDFVFIVEIPEASELNETVRRDLLALCLLRLNKGLPVVFSVNMNLTTLDNIEPQSFIGRLILPFAPVNKPIIVEDIGSINDSYQVQWRQIDEG